MRQTRSRLSNAWCFPLARRNRDKHVLSVSLKFVTAEAAESGCLENTSTCSATDVNMCEHDVLIGI